MNSFFAHAWSELPRLHLELYEYNDSFQDKFINPNLRNAVKDMKEASTNSMDESEMEDLSIDESSVKALIKESENVKDVYYIGKSDQTQFGLFTKEFCDLLLEELDYLSNSGIPMRRPNGMNRYGAILGNLYIFLQQ